MICWRYRREKSFPVRSEDTSSSHKASAAISAHYTQCPSCYPKHYWRDAAVICFEVICQVYFYIWNPRVSCPLSIRLHKIVVPQDQEFALVCGTSTVSIVDSDFWLYIIWEPSSSSSVQKTNTNDQHHKKRPTTTTIHQVLWRRQPCHSGAYCYPQAVPIHSQRLVDPSNCKCQGSCSICCSAIAIFRTKQAFTLILSRSQT